jgi:hypothetical protein
VLEFVRLVFRGQASTSDFEASPYLRSVGLLQLRVAKSLLRRKRFETTGLKQLRFFVAPLALMPLAVAMHDTLITIRIRAPSGTQQNLCHPEILDDVHNVVIDAVSIGEVVPEPWL